MSDVVYPENEHLRFWYRCYRKVAFHTKEQAAGAAAQFEGAQTVPYLCPYGRSHWHNGKPVTGKNYHKNQGPSMMRKMWRRTEKKPTLTALGIAYVNGTDRYAESNPKLSVACDTVKP